LNDSLEYKSLTSVEITEGLGAGFPITNLANMALFPEILFLLLLFLAVSAEPCTNPAQRKAW